MASISTRHARTVRRGIEHGRILGARAGAIPSERSYPFRSIKKPSLYQRAVKRAWEATWWKAWGAARVWDGVGHPTSSNFPDMAGICHIRRCEKCQVDFQVWSGMRMSGQLVVASVNYGCPDCGDPEWACDCRWNGVL